MGNQNQIVQPEKVSHAATNHGYCIGAAMQERGSKKACGGSQNGTKMSTRKAWVEQERFHKEATI